MLLCQTGFSALGGYLMGVGLYMAARVSLRFESQSTITSCLSFSLGLVMFMFATLSESLIQFFFSAPLRVVDPDWHVPDDGLDAQSRKAFKASLVTGVNIIGCLFFVSQPRRG